jgi:hypothetical protein
MTLEEIEKHKHIIDEMSQYNMCELHRFAPSGHPYFISGTELNDYWQKKFKGFTPEISKELGWSRE